MLYRQNHLLGALFIVASELLFASMGAAVKAVSAELPSEVVVFMRNALGLAVLLPILWQQKVNLRTAHLGLHLQRALLGLSAMYCFFYALAHLPLAEGVLLKMTSPFFMPLIALLWLGEGVSRGVLLALPLGFFGVFLVLSPEGGFNSIALVGLAGGFLAAAAKVTVRRLGRSEPTLRVVFWFALIATLVSALPLGWAWQTPSPTAWGLLLLMGAMGTAGQMLLTRGYATAPAAVVGPFTYFSVLFATAYGYLFWDEVPSSNFVFGAVLIVMAGILALRRDAAAARRRQLTVDPATEQA